MDRDDRGWNGDRQSADGRGEDPPVFHPLGRVGLYLGLFLLLQLLIGVPALLLWLALTGTRPDVVATGEIPIGAVLVVYASLAPVMVPATVVFLRRLDRRPLASIGARLPWSGAPGALREAAFGAGGAVALLLVWLAVAALRAELSFGGLSESFLSEHAWLPGGNPGPFGGAVALAFYCLGFLIQGGLEEWVFRGYIYRAFRERWSWATSASATALGFALLHGPNPGVETVGLVNTFLLGIVMAAVVEGTGTLWAAVAAHGIWNFVMANVLALPVSGAKVWALFSFELEGPAWVTGGAYGPEGSWLLTGLVVVVLVALARWVDRKA